MVRLFVVCMALVGPSALAANGVKLKYLVSERGQPVCDGQFQVNLKDRYQICEAARADGRVLVRVKVTKLKGGSYRVASEIERLHLDGRIRELSKPRMVVLAGEESSMTVSEEVRGQPVEVMSLNAMVEPIN